MIPSASSSTLFLATKLRSLGLMVGICRCRNRSKLEMGDGAFYSSCESLKWDYKELGCIFVGQHASRRIEDDGGWKVDTSFMRKWWKNKQAYLSKLEMPPVCVQKLAQILWPHQEQHHWFCHCLCVTTTTVSSHVSSIILKVFWGPLCIPHWIQSSKHLQYSSTNSFNVCPGNRNTSRPTPSTLLANRPNKQPVSW